MAIFLFFFFLIVDQLTKIWAASTNVSMPVVGDWLRFEYIQNPGAAFSLFGDKEWSRGFFIVVSLLALVAFFVIYALCKSKTLKCGLMMLASGALGNLIDRVCALLQDSGVSELTGFDIGVRDFIWPTFFANFNVADIAVCLGVALIMLYLLFLGEDSIFGGFFKKKPQGETAPSAQAEPVQPERNNSQTESSTDSQNAAATAETASSARPQSIAKGEEE